MLHRDQDSFEFGPFRFTPSERLLTRNGDVVALTPRGAEALTILLRNRGHVVPKEDLMKAIWGETSVEPGSLAVTVSHLRKALGDASSEPRFIQTVSKMGYRFVGQVREIAEPCVRATEVETPPDPLVWRRRPFLLGAPLLVVGLALAVGFVEKAEVLRDTRGSVKVPPEKMRPASEQGDARRKAMQLYLYGRYFWSKRTADGLDRSIRYFQEAVAEDPDFAPAYAGLADSYTLISERGPVATSSRARAAAFRALQLDSSLADAHASLGLLSLFNEYNWREAEQEFQKAIALDPNNALAHQRYGLALAAAGRFNESLAEMRQAVECDPLSLIVNADVGWSLYLARRYEDAIAAYRKVIDLDPQFSPVHTFLAMAYTHKGAFEDAFREFAEARRLNRDNSYALGMHAYAKARSGDMDGARRILRDLDTRSEHEYVPPYSKALVHIGLGEREQATKLIELATQAHNKFTVYARADPFLDDLRSDPRFVALLRHMGL